MREIGGWVGVLLSLCCSFRFQQFQRVSDDDERRSLVCQNRKPNAGVAGQREHEEYGLHAKCEGDVCSNGSPHGLRAIVRQFVT